MFTYINVFGSRPEVWMHKGKAYIEASKVVSLTSRHDHSPACPAWSLIYSTPKVFSGAVSKSIAS